MRLFSETAVCYGSKDGTTKDGGPDGGKVKLWSIWLSADGLASENVLCKLCVPLLFSAACLCVLTDDRVYTEKH